MALSDVSRLLELAPPLWRALADRLHAIPVDANAVKPISRIAERANDPLRQALRRYHLAKLKTPAGYAMRLFVFRDAVDDDEARAALGGAVPLERLVEIGLVVREEDGRLRSPFFMNLANDLYVLCDDLTLGDGVMGLGHTTGDLCRASMPMRDIGSVLEVGCGASTALLLCARRAKRGVGVDIDPRAIVISKANALLNGVTNVEFYQGDLFAPVAGQTFDLIIAQPPFVAQPPGDSSVTWLHGGSRGDELPLRLLRDLPPYLAPGGRAIVLIEWPVFEGDAEPLETRVRNAVAHPEVGVLLVSDSGTDLDQHCLGYASQRPPFIGPEVERAVVARRAHLDAMHVDELRLTLNVLDRTSLPKAWTVRIDSRPFEKIDAGSPRIGKLVAAQKLLASGRAALRESTLRVPDGARFHEEDEGVLIELPDDAVIPPVRLSRPAASLISAVSEGDTVALALAAFAPNHDAELENKLLSAVELALATGVLEVVEDAG